MPAGLRWPCRKFVKLINNAICAKLLNSYQFFVHNTVEPLELVFIAIKQMSEATYDGISLKFCDICHALLVFTSVGLRLVQQK